MEEVAVRVGHKVLLEDNINIMLIVVDPGPAAYASPDPLIKYYNFCITFY
jgi:hypothetical protein